MSEHTRKRDTGEQGNPGEFASTTRTEADIDVAFDPLDPTVDWDHEDAGISWEYPTSDADSTFHENGTIAGRVLLDGTVEHHDDDGTLTHVTLDDGSTVLIDGDPDHPYVVHRRLAEFAYETHELSPTDAEARLAELSPALAAHDSANAGRIARAIADRMTDDDLYEAEALCESAAQQHALTAWMQQHLQSPTPRTESSASPATLEEARTMQDTLLQNFAEQCQNQSLPTGPSYIPVITIDHGTPSLSVEVRNVPDTMMRNRYDGNETLSPVGEELRDRVETACDHAGVDIEAVDLESDLQRGLRRLRTHSQHLHEQLDAA
ncbi:hypothetical protein FM103_13685 [Corynebacterium xerosis]|nr:hypothetical protein FM103_13685 [Corynebacterium xerosis]